ncbi:ABC transporter ATP-binding protein [candidate division TA06 bacterium]|uniref:ABC transporter ATP-binding protein n=1 Tax=candidate division TA06 bacterium TaxID=2250710 RepID=A0A660SHE4_UNCT6|nr:MAG: ABC transporter ATP-binding protein [candidate division TA06 bacterium]
MNNILIVDKLSKTYRSAFFRIKHRGIDNISFTINEGEIFGLLGPNGAGKTTILKIIVGILRADVGKLLLNNISVNNIEYKKLIGFLPENPYFHNYLTAYEFLSISGSLWGLRGIKLKDRISEVVKLTGLSRFDIEKMKIKYYSKGMIQRLGIAHAILNNPPLIIFDEPLSGLDPIGRKEVRDIILELKKDGKTVIFSSHILQDVEMICDRVGIIAKGELIRVGVLEEMLANPKGYYEVKIELQDVHNVSELTKYGKIMDIEGNKVFLLTESERQKDELIRMMFTNIKGRIIKLLPLQRNLEDEFMSLFRTCNNDEK